MKGEELKRRELAGSLPFAVVLSLFLASSAPRVATAQDSAATPAATPGTSAETEKKTVPAPGEKASQAEPERPAKQTATKKAGKPPTGRVRTDGSAVAKLVKDLIDRDTSIVLRDSLNLLISTKGKKVSLSGSAGTIYDREQSARLAEGADRVSGIHPSISIKPPSGVDMSGLEDTVEKAVRDAGVAGGSFAAKVSGDGVIELAGEVTDSWAAVNAVKKVPGVTAIRSFKAARKPGHGVAEGETPTVVPPSAEKDPEIAASVAEAYKNANLGHLSTAVERTIVKISGRAAGAQEWWIAIRTALATPGVLGVNTERLTVSGRARRAGEVRESSLVERDVRKSIRRRMIDLNDKQKGADYRIYELSVRAAQGTVMLTGRATSEDAAYAAVDAAFSVDGVQEVVNGLTLGQVQG